MDGQIGVIYCKYCGRRCMKRTSRTVENPGRSFWACPLKLGGHGWMEWDDNVSSPQAREKRSSIDTIGRLERVLAAMEEDVRQLRVEKEEMVDRNTMLKKELEEEKVYTKCLKKCVNGLLFLVLLAALFLINWGSNDDV